MGKKKPTAWRNRIIGEGEEVPDQLLANPKNWRIHPKYQQDALQGVLEEVGWVQRVIVNKRTQFVVDGHARIALAITHEQPLVPVLYVDLEEHEEDLILTSLDPISAQAATDKAKLNELLQTIESDNVALQQFLSELSAKEGLYNEVLASKELQGREVGKRPDEMIDSFLNATIKQIVLYFGAAEYDLVLEQFAQLRQQFDVETNTDVVLRLLKAHETAKSHS